MSSDGNSSAWKRKMNEMPTYSYQKENHTLEEYGDKENGKE